MAKKKSSGTVEATPTAPSKRGKSVPVRSTSSSIEESDASISEESFIKDYSPTGCSILNSTLRGKVGCGDSSACEKVTTSKSLNPHASEFVMTSPLGPGLLGGGTKEGASSPLISAALDCRPQDVCINATVNTQNFFACNSSLAPSGIINAGIPKDQNTGLTDEFPPLNLLRDGQGKQAEAANPAAIGTVQGAWKARTTVDLTKYATTESSFVEDGVIILDYSSTEKSIENLKWALVGRVIGRSFDFDWLANNLRTRWSNLKYLKIRDLGQGCFIMFFKNEEEMNKIWFGGPHLIAGYCIGLDQWHENFRPSRNAPMQVPVWVRFPGLPLHFWDERNLFRIASGVGIPVSADTYSTSFERTAYARVCIKCDISKPLKGGIKLRCPKSGDFIQTVRYEGFPSICSTCAFVCKNPAFCQECNPHTMADNTNEDSLLTVNQWTLIPRRRINIANKKPYVTPKSTQTLDKQAPLQKSIVQESVSMAPQQQGTLLPPQQEQSQQQETQQLLLQQDKSQHKELVLHLPLQQQQDHHPLQQQQQENNKNKSSAPMQQENSQQSIHETECNLPKETVAHSSDFQQMNIEEQEFTPVVNRKSRPEQRQQNHNGGSGSRHKSKGKSKERQRSNSQNRYHTLQGEAAGETPLPK